VFRVPGLGFGGEGSAPHGGPRAAFPVFGFSGFGFRFGIQVSGFGFQVSGFGFRVSGSGFRVSDFGSEGAPGGGARTVFLAALDALGPAPATPSSIILMIMMIIIIIRLNNTARTRRIIRQGRDEKRSNKTAGTRRIGLRPVDQKSTCRHAINFRA
jgi:hypothetical protein